MSASASTPVDPIDDDELLHRRIPRSEDGWYEELGDKSVVPEPFAFKPRPDDQTGLSLFRGKSDRRPHFLTPAERSATGKSKDGYYVAILCAGDLRNAGIAVEPVPLEGDPGHCEIPSLNAANRKDESGYQIMKQLVELTRTVVGPFAGNPG